MNFDLNWLSYLIFFSTGIFPLILKANKALAVYKKDSKLQLAIYGPNALPSHIDKILKRQSWQITFRCEGSKFCMHARIVPMISQIPDQMPSLLLLHSDVDITEKRTVGAIFLLLKLKIWYQLFGTI